MFVVEIEMQAGQRRYVVIDKAGALIESIERYLKYLDRIGSARQTLHPTNEYPGPYSEWERLEH